MRRMCLAVTSLLLGIAAFVAPSAQVPSAQTSDPIVADHRARRPRRRVHAGAGCRPVAVSCVRSIRRRSARRPRMDRRFAETILVGHQISAERRQRTDGRSGLHAHAARPSASLSARIVAYAWKEFDATVAQLEALAEQMMRARRGCKSRTK